MLDKYLSKLVSLFDAVNHFAPNRAGVLAVCLIALGFALPASAQKDESGDGPVIVQPGAPGQTTRILPADTKAKLPPVTPKDVEFMQGMIHHHAQAVEMTALIGERTQNKEIRLLGARISQSQTDEINFMKRWLAMRGEKTSMAMPKMNDKSMSGHHHHEEMLMPGMLSKEQMEALRKASEAEFDRLFLTGMIQHHEGALVMVDELFKTPGAGQEAQLFNFATDVDSSQRAEIRIMQTILGEKP
jgi:uncharacterized protein (DUF305 family)